MDLSRRMVLGLGSALPLLFACNRPRAYTSDPWMELRSEAFDLPEGIVNLDNGWSATPPRVVREAYHRLLREVEALPAKRLAEQYQRVTKPIVRPEVADLLGVPDGQVALLRNATEGLGTVLLGYPLVAGDEVVASAQDYWHMLDMLDERATREGIVLRPALLPIPAPSEDAIVQAYAAAMSNRTRMVLVTHVSNRTGQVFPVRRIAELAHQRGAVVVVDAAQTLGLLEHQVLDLDCDFYAASLHKWLMAPLGTGVLWMRPEHVARVRPRFGGTFGVTTMDKFEAVGTVAEPAFVAIREALAFHRELGPARKEARIRELARGLRDRLRSIRGAKFYTIEDTWASCALLTIEIEGRDPVEITKALWEQHQVLAQAQAPKGMPAIRGIRFSPSIHTTGAELDRAADALADVLARA
jgi:isopenicillin-N epimerase